MCARESAAVFLLGVMGRWFRVICRGYEVCIDLDGVSFPVWFMFGCGDYVRGFRILNCRGSGCYFLLIQNEILFG